MSTRTEDENIRAKIFGPTLDESGRLRACSASQVKTHKLCPRKWWYQKVAKKPKGPKSKGAQESTEAHDRMEDFLKTGGDVRNGVERHGSVMLDEFIHRVPWKGGDMMVEEPLKAPELHTPGGVLITGFFDAALPPAGALPVVLDHKFLKDVDKYAATEEELETDEPQATMYMAWILTRYSDAPAVRFRHHNHQKKGKRYNLPVEIVQTREQVFARMAALGKYIDTNMQATAAVRTETAVPIGESGCCQAFGGCEYLKDCPDAPHKRFLRAMQGDGDLPSANWLPSKRSEPAALGETFMGLMDDLDLGDAPPPPSGATNPLPAAKPQAQAAAPAALTRLEAQAAKVGGVYMLPGGKPGKCKGADDGKVVFVTADKLVVELELDDLVKDLNGDATAVGLFKRKLLIDDKTATPDPAPAAPKPEVPGGNPPPVSAKAGVIPPDAPGDTNKEEPKPQAPAPKPPPEVKVAVAEVAPAAPAPEAPKAKRGRPAKAAAVSSGFILIVDAASSVGESLEQHVTTLAQKICEREGLADLRLAPKGTDASFMGWRGLLAIEAKKFPPQPGTVLVGSSGDLADPVIEALAPLADIYVKGSRR